MTTQTTDLATYAAAKTAELDRRREAIRTGQSTRDASGTWRNPDWCEVVGRDGIDTTATQQGAFYSHNEVPWWSLGTLTGTVTDEALGSADAIVAAGLAWDVEKRPVFFGATDESVMGTGKVADQFAVVRTDTEAALSIVGKVWSPFQNRDMFRFLADLIANGQITFETAGSLDGGRKVFASMFLPNDIVLDADGAADVIKPYVLAINYHGNGSFLAATTPLRVECANTARWAVEGAISKWTVRHTVNALDRYEEARKSLGLSISYYDRYAAEGEKMLQTTMSAAEFDRFIEWMFPIDSDATNRQRNAAEGKRDKVRELHDTAPTTTKIRGSVWGAEQAAVEWLDFHSQVKPGRTLREDIARAERIVTGEQDDRKTNIHRRLLTLTNR